MTKSEITPKPEAASTRRTALLPEATYRVQFNKEFTFRQAAEIVPYLSSLGISHLYASPILKARPGSMHGYDIIDHKQLNPEIGTRQEFDQLVTTLREHGMGLIVDFVPNHMGVGPDNPWWVDVLENGEASSYADYFDIDWSPIKRGMEGKVLIPVLGEPYGKVLESGQFNLSFDEQAGTLSLNYYEHRFPLNPMSYPHVLGLRVTELARRMGEHDPDFMEFLSILGALERLPGHTSPSGFSQRICEKTVQCRRLAAVCARNGTVRAFVQENVQRFTPQQADLDDVQRLHNLLEMQAYRLSYWRVAFDEINYRRFFDVNDLAALRTEDKRVFDDIHSLIFDLVADRKIDGLRIDHMDGLFDPQTYFKRVQSAAAERLLSDFNIKDKVDAAQQRLLPLYVVAEKILAPFEQLELPWMVHGTTGYDYLDAVNNLLVAEENESQFTELYDDCVGSPQNYDALKRECKGLILDTILASELSVLAHWLSYIAEASWFFRDLTLNSLRAALREIVVHFPVYRTYAGSAGTSDTVRQYVDWAVALAKRHSNVPEAVFDFIAGVLRMDLPADSFGATRRAEVARWQESFREFAVKFQQFTGPVTAKSVEDTLFYRYARFVGLNEVGSEPKRFGTSAAAFHHQNTVRQSNRPYSMLATSTHDTKRSEDVRARLAVISELPRVWRITVERWHRANKRHKTTVGDESAPDANDEYFLYQTLVGAWSAAEQVDSFVARMKQYAVKALREAKRHTSWVNQNSAYEDATCDFIEHVLRGESFVSDLRWFADRLAQFGYINSLVQTTFKLTSPGVPDIYQGNELWDFSLVDPDNRRPVDFELRKQTLETVVGKVDQFKAAGYVPESAVSAALQHSSSGPVKLLVIAGLLAVRRRQPALLREGEYIPLNVEGPRASNLLAFARRSGQHWAVVVVPLKVSALLGKDESTEHFYEGDIRSLLASDAVWQNTTVELPQQLSGAKLHNIFGGSIHSLEQNKLSVAPLFKQLPTAVLIPKE